MYGWRAQVGLLVPSVNTCSEPEFRRMAPPGVEFFTTRLRLRGGGGRAELRAMADKVEEAASLLADLEPSFILFHCTGASMVGGVGYDEELRARIERVTNRPAGATATGVVLALRALGARRIAFISPAPAENYASEAAFLEAHGFEVVASQWLNIVRGLDRVQMDPGDWYRVVRAIDVSQADAILVTCTNARVVEAIDWLEQDCGLPVVTSNQGSLWYVLRRLCIRDRIDGYGRLLRECLDLSQEQ